MKRLTITLSFALFFACTYAQNVDSVEWKNNSKFSIGLHLGASQSGTDTHSWGRHGEGILDKAAFAFGANARYSLSDNLGLRANFFSTKISGDDNDLTGPCNSLDADGNETPDDDDNPCHQNRGWSFTSPLTEVSLDLEWELFGHKRNQSDAFYDANGNRVNVRNIMMSDATYYDKDGDIADLSSFGKTKKVITPYFGIGAAATFVNPDIDFGDTDVPGNAAFLANKATDEENFKKLQWQFPVTAGLRFDLTEKLFLDLEARGVLQTSDMLDGMEAVTNNGNELNNDDSYQMLLARLSIRLGGIGDSDKDGINDNVDQCPNEPGLVSQWGCPDTDGDGIIDKMDACPNVPGIKRMNGCADTDGDNIADNKDDCPKVAGIARFNGCPDTDGDGIQDKDDKCVNTPGEKAYNGCPAPDRDKDGVLDANDPCPDTYGTVKGCPDTDGDGIIDIEDKCPTVKGIAAEKGCPKKIVKPAVTRPVLLTCETIYFNTNQSSVSNNTKDRYLDSKENMATFNRALAKLKENPSYRAVVQGHTDSRNTEEYNQALSERRANEVLQDLLKKGFDASRTSAVGFGELSPVSSNDTKEGRAQNRRVEICIYDR